MDVTVAQHSDQGAIRSNNEDFLGFWVPTDEGERELKGCVAIIADGVGGQGDGEVASRMAVEAALKRFKAAKPDQSVNSLLWQMFNHANLEVYDASMVKESREGRMATTMTATVFRNNQIAIGHVGDCRAYLIHGGAIKCLTTDHTFIAFHQKIGLFTPEVEGDSPLRGALTRCIGKDPVVPIDFYYAQVAPGDCVVQCSDGVHSYVSEDEIVTLVRHNKPSEAAKDLVALVLARGGLDNISVQIIQVDAVTQLSYYRGTPVITKPTEASKTMGHEVQVGQVLDDRFEITAVISRSGMASIFKAVDRNSGQFVALKVPFMQFESDPAFYDRFVREEAIGRKLDHPSILRLIHVNEEHRSRPYIAMEFLKGQTLDNVMQNERPMEIGKAMSITGRLCDALAHMHEKSVVHRDMKPQNVMMCEDGSLRIVDFGIAKAAGMRRITFAGFSPALGTPDYMAPEQVKGKRGDERTDIYSLGAMLYEMVTGHTPFEAENPYMIMQARITGDPVAPRKLNPAITPELEEIILQAMARDPAERYQSAAAMKADLDHPEAVKVTGRAERLQKPSGMPSRWRAMLPYAIVPLIMVVVTIVLVIVLHGHK